MTCTPVTTFAEYKDHPGLQAMAIEISAFEVTVTADWVKSAVKPYHWDRLVSIAETTETEYQTAPGKGFSWVTAVVVDDIAIALEPPTHLRELVAR